LVFESITLDNSLDEHNQQSNNINNSINLDNLVDQSLPLESLFFEYITVYFDPKVIKDLMSYSTIFIDDQIVVPLLLQNSHLGMVFFTFIHQKKIITK